MSGDTDRILDKLDGMDERHREFEIETKVALAEIRSSIAEDEDHEGRIALLELDKARREGATKASRRRGTLVAAGATTGAAGGVWALLERLLG